VRAVVRGADSSKEEDGGWEVEGLNYHTGSKAAGGKMEMAGGRRPAAAAIT